MLIFATEAKDRLIGVNHHEQIDSTGDRFRTMVDGSCR
jgi:hypothetical protein